MAGPNVIPLQVPSVMQPSTAEGPAITRARLRDAARQLDELRRCAERVALDPQWSAMEWRATCTPFLIRLPEARQLLASLSPIRIGHWPDTEWAARVRTTCGNIECRLEDVVFAMGALTSGETNNPDAAASLMSDAPLLAGAASELQALITTRYLAASSAEICKAGINSHDEFRSLDRGRGEAHEITEDLARQMSMLTDILQYVGDEARLMDASLDDTHEIAGHVSRLVKYGIFGSDGPLSMSSHSDIYCQFEQAQADESDVYEVYADDLERHQKRRRKDLALADADADKATVTNRRRSYIAILFDFCAQVSKIVDRLDAH